MLAIYDHKFVIVTLRVRNIFGYPNVHIRVPKRTYFPSATAVLGLDLTSVHYPKTRLRRSTISVLIASERRAARIFPLISVWALTQRDRADIAPATGTIGMDEASTRAVLPRLTRIRVVGVFGLGLFCASPSNRARDRVLLVCWGAQTAGTSIRRLEAGSFAMACRVERRVF